MLGRLIDRVVVPVARALAWAGGGLMLLSAGLVSAEVLLRNLFSLSVLNSFELTIYMFAAATAFAFSFALVERVHIRIDILLGLLPRPVRAILDVVSLAGLAALAALFAQHAWRTAMTSERLGAVSNSSLAVPLVVPQGIWALALTWFALTAFLLALDAALALSRGRLDRVERRGGIPVAAHEEGFEPPRRAGAADARGKGDGA